ncbi:MAG: HipA N-terminal domain-containing protein, partial [Gammaproteobacteria bacterium]
MKISTDQRIRKIDIKVAGEAAGLLENNTRFNFTYHSNATFPVAVSMPLEKRAYQSGALFPIFEMNIPEGFIRYRITERLRKQLRVDDMLFLALQGKTGIGCISYAAQGVEAEEM